MFKKLFSALLCVALMFSCTTVAIAASDDLEFLPDSYDIGDVDMDGRISIMDATQIQMHLAGLLEIVQPTEPTQPPTVDDDKPIELPFVPAS